MSIERDPLYSSNITCYLSPFRILILKLVRGQFTSSLVLKYEEPAFCISIVVPAKPLTLVGADQESNEMYALQNSRTFNDMGSDIIQSFPSDCCLPHTVTVNWKD